MMQSGWRTWLVIAVLLVASAVTPATAADLHLETQQEVES